jgi:N-acetylmuramoyl-L-alanine amidase
LSQHGIKSFIVTPELNDTSLSTRAARVNKRVEENKKKGISTILFSVHLNAAGNGKSWTNATGWECWTTKGKTKSDILAECAYDAASELLSGFNVKMRTDNTDGDRDKENNWTILYKSNCPCILTENMFMDNKGDYEFLMSPYGKDLIANVHVKTVLNWCHLNT